MRGYPVVTRDRMPGEDDAMRVKLTPAFIEKVKPPAHGRALYWDSALPGFGLQVMASGHKSFVVSYRANGRKRRMSLKAGLTLTDARKEAKAILGAVAKGGNPLQEKRRNNAKAGNTLRAVVEHYLEREGGLRRDANGSPIFKAGKNDKGKDTLRTAADRLRDFERLVFPKLGSRPIADVTRADITKLLDKIEDKNGPRMATLMLAYLRRVFRWHQARVDGFANPIVPGMARGAPSKCDRILTDDELLAFWQASIGWDHPFSHMLRVTLLTMVRRNEAAGMEWSELEEDGLWVIPAARYKTKVDFEVPLSNAARDVLNKTARISRKFVFTTTGLGPIKGFAKLKTTFDDKMLAELRKLAEERGDDPRKVSLPRWTIHDLRRSGRSLMSRCGVNPDVAERCLGHVVAGVRGVYDRHSFHDEKKLAFEALAGLIERVVHPTDNVVPLRAQS